MIFQAILSNKAHPEYCDVRIPFPLSTDQYDEAIDWLEAMEIGDIQKGDCHVDDLDSKYPVLNCLISQVDYLAKRLDSFDDGEDVKFEAMVSKLGLSDIKDLINLTFCCQETTVITDFSDLEQVGKSHSLTINGGFMSTEEYDMLDGRSVALEHPEAIMDLNCLCHAIQVLNTAEREKLEGGNLVAQKKE